MYHQRQLAVAVSAALAISVFSGCSSNSAIKKSSSYQHSMGDVEFQKSAHLLINLDKSKLDSQGANIKTASYNQRTSGVKLKKSAYHSTRTEHPRKGSVTKDLEKAAEILGVTKQPAVSQTLYRPANNSQAYRPVLREVAHLLGVGPKYDVTQPVTERQTQLHKQAAGNDDMWERIYRGQKIGNYGNHPKVRRFIKGYASDRARLNRITNRASKYLFMIVAELERRNMPTELALLPFVESAYVNTARSHAAAAGMWQFIPSTGRLYGLKQRRGYDGRMDSFEATRAALDYLQKLNRDFKGDWFLSLAAYNAGEGRVQRAINYNRSKGRPTNYWSLRLPRETREYVPRLLAYKEIIRHPERYGISLPVATSRPALVPVQVNKVIDLRKAARRAGLPIDTLTELNPSYLQGITTPRLSKRIILPARHAGRLHHIIRKMPSGKDSNYRYTKRYAKKRST
ncbi:MAG: transglycosylase SLT domain-containing protein, partial [Cocleimonas sp.]|nr:transglycosylase SLT domain-containing protein [Cocleimonas sp.]